MQSFLLFSPGVQEVNLLNTEYQKHNYMKQAGHKPKSNRAGYILTQSTFS